MSKSNMSLPTAILVLVVATLANAVGYIFSFWLAGSLITSGMKSYKGQCGTKYNVEKYYLDGNFFCG